MEQGHPCGGSYWHGHCRHSGANFDRNVCLCTFVNRPELRVRAFISFYTTFTKKLHDPKKRKKEKKALLPWLTARYAHSERKSNVCLCKWFTFQEAFVICQINTWRMRQGGVSSPGRAGHPPSFLTTSFAEVVPRRESKQVAVCRVWPSSYSQALSCLITLVLKGQSLAKEYPALSYPSC